MDTVTDEPQYLDLGEIEVEVDDQGELIVQVEDDPYFDDFAHDDFQSSAVALIADYHTATKAERRGKLVAMAKNEHLGDHRNSCFPTCTAKRFGLTPVFKYDKILIADTTSDMRRLERQLDGISGFFVRTLAQDIAEYKEGNRDEALRPIRPSDSKATEIDYVVDPAIRHCSLPEEACANLSMDIGKWVRSANDTERVRLVPGDKVELIRFDPSVPGSDPATYTPDPSELVNGLLTPGDVDRALEDAGIRWNNEVLAKARSAAAQAAASKKQSNGLTGEPVKAPKAPVEPLTTQASVKPKADPKKMLEDLKDELGSMKTPGKKKTNSGESIVKIYRSSMAFNKDENDAKALYGREFDDTPRNLLLEAGDLTVDSKTLKDRIRAASSTKLSAETVENIVNGGRRIQVGDMVALLDPKTGVRQVFSRAKEEKTGKYFWALKTSHFGKIETGKCDTREDKSRKCFPAPPDEDDFLVYRRTVLETAIERLNSAKDGKDTADEAESKVSRIRLFEDVIDTYQPPLAAGLTAKVSYVRNQKDTYENDLYVPSPPEDPGPETEIKTGTEVETFAEIAARSLFYHVIRDIKISLPVSNTVEWITGLCIPRVENLAAINHADAPDTVRFKFLITTALNVGAVVMLLGDQDSEDIASRIETADISPFLKSAKASEGWAKASEKILTPVQIQKAGEALRQRSPMFDHMIDVVHSRKGLVEETKISHEVSKLSDWVGYRPAEMTKSKNDSVSIQPPSKSGDDSSPLSAKEARDSSWFVNLAKEHGFRESDVISAKSVIESHADEADRALVSSYVSGILALFRASRSLPEGLRRTPAAEASEALAIAKTTKATEKDVRKAWGNIAGLTPELFTYMVADLSERGALMSNNVSALLSTMEKSKESIKNEKIDIIESMDEELQETFMQMRRLGLQTINEQILMYDKYMGTVDPADPEVAKDEHYDTMEFFNDDDGLSYE